MWHATRVADYTTTASGLQFQDLVPGSGAEVSEGDTVVIDWDGYTIGYYGRPFEARNKVTLCQSHLFWRNSVQYASYSEEYTA